MNDTELLKKRVDRAKEQHLKFKNRKVKQVKQVKPVQVKKKKRIKQKKKKYKTKEQYRKELKDKRWLKKREIILKLDNYTCRHCGNTKYLTVHHKTYIGNRKAWQYPNDLLITLCKGCHMKVHYINC